MQNFPEIVARVEEARAYLGLNKSRFAAEIGLKPQTYNNFIGPQASKPNVSLIVGLASRFHVNPLWLLLGEGPMFRQVPDPPGGGAGGSGGTSNILTTVPAPSHSDNGIAAKLAEARQFIQDDNLELAAAAYRDAGCSHLAEAVKLMPKIVLAGLPQHSEPLTQEAPHGQD